VAKLLARLQIAGWSGGDGMARLIEFYIPESFRRKVKWVPPGQRGKLIEFRTGLKQSA
jgi:hypothetical protein